MSFLYNFTVEQSEQREQKHKTYNKAKFANCKKPRQSINGAFD